MMKLIEDRYNGATIDYSDGYDDFKQALSAVLKKAEQLKLLWITVPITDSEHIPVLTKLGFSFFDCQPHQIVLVKKLTANPVMPTATNHTLGVGAAVFNGAQLLVVQDRFQNGYKLPGGQIDCKEHISTAMTREVFEETGIKAVFKSIVAMGHFFPGQFDQSDLYIVCRGKALSTEINIQDCIEIADAKWIDIEQYLADDHNHIYNKMIVKAAIQGGGFVISEQKMPNRPNWSRELFFLESSGFGR